MNVVFRVDASIKIGSGHVMRCLALADQMKTNGMTVNFVCRDLPGQMSEQIQQRGHKTVLLSEPSQEYVPTIEDPDHANWLNVPWEQDAEETIQGIIGAQYDWLIVDHYGLDARWHRKLRKYVSHILVIDDLADRMLDCDLLLDQTFHRSESDYQEVVNKKCKMLLGSEYALLRPEFAHWREHSLKRRVKPELKRLLISIGGVDPGNVTSQILEVLNACNLPEDLKITIVLGVNSPHIESVMQIAGTMRNSTEVKVNVNNMAELMANSDLAIGAAGCTSWERCCLGLPTLMVVLADNQKNIADSLEASGAALVFRGGDSQKYDPYIKQDIMMFLEHPERLREMSHISAGLTEGDGAGLVAQKLLGKCGL